MSKFSKIFAVFGLIVVVVGFGLVVGWWGTSRTPSGPIATANDPSQMASGATGSAPANPSVDLTQKNPVARTNPVISSRPTPVPQPATNTVGIPNWEEKIDAILTSEIPDNEKAKKMLEMFPQLSPEAQEEVAHHLSNLVPDEEYAPLGNYLTNAALSEAVLDVLLEDVFNRPNSVKLPLLLDIARNPQHPKASESKDVLELFLEEDYGNDWSKWQAKMDQWLKENPD
jgi:hypothetical protein